MKRLAETAFNKNELLKASFYFRASEFYTFPDDPEKEILYDKFSELFYEFFKNDNIEKLKIPYETSFLHIIRILPANNKKCKGTILFHGGFDSFIEEFYTMSEWIEEKNIL